ncbi:MAG: carbohydrate ABC transporter permease [Clostridia bacterium]|nr:carbohydrate ABC transporter permease [Clostridia bacterium]
MQAMVSRHKPRRKKIKPLWIAVTVLFAIYTVVLVAPYVYGFLVSIETDFEFQNSIFPHPRTFKISNYLAAWKDLSSEETSVIMMFVNSLWFSVGTTVVGLFYATTAAYVVSKYRFPMRKFIFSFALVMMMVPIIGGMASNLKFTSALGGYNSPLYVFINAQTLGGSFIIIVSCFNAVDWGYAEAAYIDGAGHFSVFFRVMLPQLVSPLCALALTDFIMFWADTDTALIYFPNLPTLSTGLYLYQDVVERLYNYPVYYAGLITCMIPSIVLFSVFQKSLMDIQMGGGLKG